MAYYSHYLVKKLTIYHYFENMKECTIFLKFEFAMNSRSKNSSSLKNILWKILKIFYSTWVYGTWVA